MEPQLNKGSQHRHVLALHAHCGVPHGKALAHDKLAWEHRQGLDGREQGLEHKLGLVLEHRQELGLHKVLEQEHKLVLAHDKLGLEHKLELVGCKGLGLEHKLELGHKQGLAHGKLGQQVCRLELGQHKGLVQVNIVGLFSV